MILGVPKESYPGERRVALVPLVVPNLIKAGFEVVVEASAGMEAGYLDAQYVEKGARIVPNRADVFAAADIVLQVLCYGSNDVSGEADLPLLRRGQILIGFLRPLGSKEAVERIAATGVTSFSVELMPRTTRAQSMDALSSMGTICGYKAVLVAAETLPRIFPMLTTAAGTVDTGSCSCDRRWRCRASGNRYRASFGSGHVRLRLASRGQRAGTEFGCTLR